MTKHTDSCSHSGIYLPINRVRSFPIPVLSAELKVEHVLILLLLSPDFSIPPQWVVRYTEFSKQLAKRSVLSTHVSPQARPKAYFLREKS